MSIFEEKDEPSIFDRISSIGALKRSADEDLKQKAKTEEELEDKESIQVSGGAIETYKPKDEEEELQTGPSGIIGTEREPDDIRRKDEEFYSGIDEAEEDTRIGGVQTTESQSVQGRLELTDDGDAINQYHPDYPEKPLRVEPKNFSPELEVAYEELKAAQQIESAARDKGFIENLPFIGGAATIGEGIGSVYGQRKASKALDNKMELQMETMEELRGEFRDAFEDEDWDRAEELNNIIGLVNESSKPYIENLQEELKQAPTKREIAGSAAELAIFATFGYHPGKAVVGKGSLKLGKMAKPMKSTTTMGPSYKLAKTAPLKAPQKAPELISSTAKLLNVGKKYGIKSISTGTRIGLFSAAGEMKVEDAEVSDIINAAERGAKFGAVLGPAFSAGASMLKVGFDKSAPVLKKHSNTVIKKLERIAEGKEKVPQNPVERALEGIEKSSTIKQKLAKTALKPVNALRKAKQKILDRHSPLERLEYRILDKKGETLSENEKLFRDARMLDAWSSGMAEKKLQPLFKKLYNYSESTQEKAKSYLQTLDYIDRAKLGQKVPGDKSLPELKKELAELTRYIGEDEMKQVAEIRKTFINFHRDQLMDDVAAGLISKKEALDMIKAHPNYLPHSVISEKTGNKFSKIGSSLDVSETHLKKAVGSVKNIKDPYSATVGNSLVAEKTRQKNQLISNIINAHKDHDLMSGAKKLKSGQKPKDGFGVISYFNKGTKERWQVPKTIAESIKHTDSPISGPFLETVAKVNKVLKKSATSYNPAFIVRNKVRDVQRAALYADPFIKKTAEKYGLAKEPVGEFTGKNLKKLYDKGGFGSSIFREGDSAAIDIMRKGGVSSSFKFDNINSINPLKALERVNLAVEKSTRKEVLARALNSGLSKKDAVWVSRNTSIDFSRMGSWMRPANKAIPFLNAQVQGLSKLPEAILKDPERFGEAAFNTAAFPAFSLHQHNRRFESYPYINQGLKANNWIIMTGEVPAEHPDTGEQITVPQFVTLPRGEGQSLLAAPIQFWLEREDQVDHRGVSEMLADTVGNISPVDFGTYTNQNFAGAFMSRLGPIGSGLYGSASGEHAFFGTDIVPRDKQGAERHMQFRHDTPEILKDIPEDFYKSGFAETFNISPAMADYYTSIFGGAVHNTLKALDIAYGVKRDGKIGGLNEVTETPWETASNIPFINSFARQTTSNVMDWDRGMIADSKKAIQTDRLELKDRAEKIVDEIESKETPEERKKVINLLGDDLTPDLFDEITNQFKVRESVKGLRATDSRELRANVIFMRVNEMRERNYTDEQVRDYVEELQEKGILDNEVAEMLNNLAEHEW